METFLEMSLLILCVVLFADGGIVTVAAVVLISGLGKWKLGINDVLQEVNKVLFK